MLKILKYIVDYVSSKTKYFFVGLNYLSFIFSNKTDGRIRYANFPEIWDRFAVGALAKQYTIVDMLEFK